MPAQQAIAQEGLLWFPSQVRDAPKMCRSRALDDMGVRARYLVIGVVVSPCCRPRDC